MRSTASLAPRFGVPAALALEPPASTRYGADGQYNFGGTRASFAELAAALLDTIPFVLLSPVLARYLRLPPPDTHHHG